MTKERVFQAVLAFLLAAAISFAAIGCMVTGLRIDADLGFLFRLCLAVSLVWTIACQFRWIPVALLATAEVWILADWLLGGSIVPALQDSLEVLVVHITKYYDRGYHWGIVQWSEVLPQASPDLILGILAGTVALMVSWVISHRRSALWAVPVACLPLFFTMVLSDTVPDTEYLAVFLTGIALLVMTNSLRRKSTAQGNRVTALLLVPTVLVMMLLFGAIPREGYVPLANGLSQWLEQFAWGGASDVVADNPAERVQLGDLGNQTNSYRTVLHVRSSISGRLYLRGRSYDSYDGRSWTATEISSGKDTVWSSASITNRGSVTIETVKPQSYFYFPTIVGTDVQQKIFTKGILENPNKETKYIFSWGTVNAGGRLGEGARAAYLALPTKTSKLATMQLINWELPRDTAALAEMIADKVRAAASYNLSPSIMPDTAEDFAMWFYQEAEEGYCVHFATTAAVLLRAAGVPARYVTGYVVNVRANREESISARQAHAWVEYFDEEKGWVILEATPSYEQDTPATQPTESTTVPTEDTTVPTQPEETTTPTEDTTQPSASESQPETLPTQETPPQQEEKESGNFLWLLWTALWAAAIWGQYRLRQLLKRRYLRRGDSNQQALRLWREVLRQSRILGETPPKEIRELAEKAKFSQYTLTQEELQEFDAQLAVISEKLREKPWVFQWILRLVFAI